MSWQGDAKGKLSLEGRYRDEFQATLGRGRDVESVLLLLAKKKKYDGIREGIEFGMSLR